MLSNLVRYFMMKTKNISINIKKKNLLPFKETYLVFYTRKKKVKMVQKFVNSKKNQSIVLNYEECTRLMNLFNRFFFEGNYKPIKDHMVVFQED